MTKEKTIDMISKEGKRALSGLLQNPRFTDARSKRYIRCLMGEFDILPTLDVEKKKAIDSIMNMYSDAIVDPSNENIQKVKGKKNQDNKKESKKVESNIHKTKPVEPPQNKSNLDLTNTGDEIDNDSWLNDNKEQPKPRKKRTKK